MGIIEVLFTALGLSMDSAAVSTSNGMCNPLMKINKVMQMAFIFAILQGVMPLIGYYSGSLFINFIEKIAPWLTFIILGVIGMKMIIEALKGNKGIEKEKNECQETLTYKKIFIQGIATSIDAFAIGVSLIALEQSGALLVNIYHVVITIIVITFFICILSALIGQKFGSKLSNKAEIFGGIILIVIGLKIFIESILLK